jgi:hypothetical protein
MIVVKWMSGPAAMGMAILLGSGLSASSGSAAYIVTLVQQGGDVVETGSGTINLAGLRSLGSGSGVVGRILPRDAEIVTGPTSSQPFDAYGGFSGPTSFGSGGLILADSGSGDIVGIIGAANQLVVPSGYVSGSALSDTSTYDNQTFASLSVTPDTYVWKWANDPTPDSFTVEIEAPAAAVLEPCSSLPLAPPLGLVMILARYRRRRQLARAGPARVSARDSLVGHGQLRCLSHLG